MKLLFGLEAHAPGMLLGSLIAAISTVALISFVSRISRVKEDTAIGIMYTGFLPWGLWQSPFSGTISTLISCTLSWGYLRGCRYRSLGERLYGSHCIDHHHPLFPPFSNHHLRSDHGRLHRASRPFAGLPFDHLRLPCRGQCRQHGGGNSRCRALDHAAATAYLLSDRLDKMMGLAALFGVTSVVGGLYLCVWLDSAGGGAIMLFCTLQFLVVLVVAPKYGLFSRWMRLRNLIPSSRSKISSPRSCGMAAPRHCR